MRTATLDSWLSRVSDGTCSDTSIIIPWLSKRLLSAKQSGVSTSGVPGFLKITRLG